MNLFAELITRLIKILAKQFVEPALKLLTKDLVIKMHVTVVTFTNQSAPQMVSHIKINVMQNALVSKSFIRADASQ